MTTLPKMNLSPESVAWGRAIEKLALEGKKTSKQHSTQIAANNQQANAAHGAVRDANSAVVAVATDINTGRQEPNTPITVAATSTGSWDSNGTAQGNISVSWEMPFDDTYPAAASYEVWYKDSTLPDSAYIRLGASTTLAFVSAPLAPATNFTVRVCAVTGLGITGPYSATATVTTATPANTLEAASTPTVSSSLGAIVVNWDGKTASGVLAPVQTMYANAYMSATSTGTYVAAGQTILGAGSIVIGSETPGATRWIKLQLTDKLGRASALSTAVSIVVAGNGVDTVQINSDLSGLRTDLNTNITATGTAQTQANTATTNAATADAKAVTAQATSDAAALSDTNTINPIFAKWTGAYPDYYGVWNTAPVKETTIVRAGLNAMRFNVADTTTQYGAIFNTSLNPSMGNAQYVTVTLDVYLVSGTLGQAGVLLDWAGMTNNRATLNLFDEIPSPQLGKWYRVSKVLTRPAGATGTFTGFSGYLMGQYSGMTSGAAIKNVIFDRLSFRPSTAEEIVANAAKATADSALTIANGKNKIVFSTLVASGTAYSAGDIWFQKSGTLIIGQWEFVAGAWALRQLDDAVIGNLNAGTINAGFLNAARIDVNTISAGMIAADQIVTTHMTAGAINGDRLTVNTLNADRIVGLSITAAKIAALTITANEIAANAITATKILAGSLDAFLITGMNMQTVATALRGIKISSAGILGYNSVGAQTFSINSSTGAVAITGDFTSGSANSIFKATTAGIQLGNAVFASAPFRVTAAGALFATGATISGTITGSTITGSTIQTAASGQHVKVDATQVKFYSATFDTDQYAATISAADNGASGLVLSLAASGGAIDIGNINLPSSGSVGFHTMDGYIASMYADTYYNYKGQISAPFAMASGFATISVGSGGNFNSVAITFPAGRFITGVVPVVTVSISNAPGGSQKFVPRSYSQSATGATIGVYSGDFPGYSPNAFTVQVAWTAIQMTSTTAAG